MEFTYNDGGRKEAGYKGEVNDCVTRAISILTGIPYKTIYKELQKRGASPRTGISRKIYEPYLLELGYKWIPTSGIGQGCKVHLKQDELPNDKIIVRVSRHLSCVINGIINDTFDCSRNKTRCVYGYYIKNK